MVWLMAGEASHTILEVTWEGEARKRGPSITKMAIVGACAAEWQDSSSKVLLACEIGRLVRMPLVPSISHTTQLREVKSSSVISKQFHMGSMAWNAHQEAPFERKSPQISGHPICSLSKDNWGVTFYTWWPARSRDTCPCNRQSSHDMLNGCAKDCLHEPPPALTMIVLSCTELSFTCTREVHLCLWSFRSPYLWVNLFLP